MKKKKWWFRFWSNNIFLVPLYLLLQWCCLINSHCFSKMWCFFKLWWKFQYLNCLTVNLKIYLGLFCPWQNGECCDPGSDYLWFQNRIIILHTFTRGKKINCWLTYLIKYSVILSCVRVLSYSDRMHVLEDGDKPVPMASILWLSPNTLSSETVKMLYKKHHKTHFVILLPQS